jgi:hypothetical protein
MYLRLRVLNRKPVVLNLSNLLLTMHEINFNVVINGKVNLILQRYGTCFIFPYNQSRILLRLHQLVMRPVKKVFSFLFRDLSYDAVSSSDFIV